MTKGSSLSGRLDVEELKKLSMAVEDLGYLLRRMKPEQLIDVSRTIAEMSRSASLVDRVSGDVDSDPNKQFLIGVLPRLLQDRDLFPINDDIVDFASDALGLAMSKNKKRSRYEIIGEVVCETDALSGRALSSVVKALSKVSQHGEISEYVKERKKSGNFSWNETIRSLAKG
jgi:hypothetical protein